ncbi:MAG: hypothetical protein FJ224_10325 [Lentisphaerae bacterium]|nr:hypothetical protein [Lentisphaerota bacterium]
MTFRHNHAPTAGESGPFPAPEVHSPYPVPSRLGPDKLEEVVNADVRKLLNRLDRRVVRRLWSHRHKRWRNAGWIESQHGTAVQRRDEPPVYRGGIGGSCRTGTRGQAGPFRRMASLYKP